MSISEKDLFKIMFNPFEWDKANYKFSRDEKDMRPYSIIKGENEIIIVHNVLGVDKKDLKLSRKTENRIAYLSIAGKTIDEITGKEYQINSRFTVNETELDLKNAVSTMKNGLLYISIPYKEAKEEDNKEEFLEIK